MNQLREDMKKTLYAAWLGGSLYAVLGIPFTDWRYWVVMLPVIGLVTAFNSDRDLDY